MFRQANGLAAAVRVVPESIPTIEQLGLPSVVKRFVRLSSGLVIVTGPTGSGKSTTLAAMVEEINSARAAHIVTIEDPVEYEYTSKTSVIHQREVGIKPPLVAAPQLGEKLQTLVGKALKLIGDVGLLPGLAPDRDHQPAARDGAAHPT